MFWQYQDSPSSVIGGLKFIYSLMKSTLTWEEKRCRRSILGAKGWGDLLLDNLQWGRKSVL